MRAWVHAIIWRPFGASTVASQLIAGGTYQQQRRECSLEIEQGG